MERPARRPAGRSYDQYCAVARALDSVGDRWTLLIVRELLAGPRRYTDLHADLPGVSTDMLATRLKDMERDGITTRRRLPAPAPAWVYQLTERGRALLPVLSALAAWGAPELQQRRATDAVRVHWLAIPLRRVLGDELNGASLVNVRTDEGEFHLRLDTDTDTGWTGAESGYGHGRAERADAHLTLDAATGTAICRGELTLHAAVRSGRAQITGMAELGGPTPREVGRSLPADNQPGRFGPGGPSRVHP